MSKRMLKKILLGGGFVLAGALPAFAEFTMPTEATGAFTDLVTAIGAFAALAWTVANASTIAKAGLRLFKSFVGKSIG